MPYIDIIQSLPKSAYFVPIPLPETEEAAHHIYDLPYLKRDNEK